MNKKFIVVGSGFTGLTTAFYLKRHGWNVEVYESGPKPGGLIGSEQTPWAACLAGGLLVAGAGLAWFAARALLPEGRIDWLRGRWGLFTFALGIGLWAMAVLRS